ncbi:MAG TPA: hypothetical protein VHH32_00475 [Gemmatimonadales bacterium]|nr:hypothetical protein [Gemmatimonadales bacterium]
MPYLRSFARTVFLAPVWACAPPGSAAPTSSTLAPAESLYADLRDLRDRIEIWTASGGSDGTGRSSLARLVSKHNVLRSRVIRRLAIIDSARLEPNDARAFGIMQRTLTRELDSLSPPTFQRQRAETRPDCAFNASRFSESKAALDSLRTRIYTCYGWAQSHVVVGQDTIDRLSVLGQLARIGNPSARERLFRTLEPVWRSINGDNGPASPYRQLIAREMRLQQDGQLPSLIQARASGIQPDSLERWLLAMLATWQRGMPDSGVEPWNWFYLAGDASRTLSPRIPRARLFEINAAVYRSLGAPVDSLRIRYDTEPRAGKTPVAYATFGVRPRFMNGAWRPAVPWVFATYRAGGLDNLNELLHETGHAVHIAAIRTRPAFTDWPDSDPFTEALADFIALEVYEPAWQLRWLGDSVPLDDGLRARYAGIVMDVSWALFELRMQRDPTADPNRVWTGITHEYLRIRPHPELSWWAMRGQLVDAPGYMMNYAAGAILIAAIRARTEELHGQFRMGAPSWYRWIAPRLFRFGLERPSREVVEEFLGGPVTPAAILSDMRRLATSD